MDVSWRALCPALADNMGWSGWETFGNLTTYEKNEREQE